MALSGVTVGGGAVPQGNTADSGNGGGVFITSGDDPSFTGDTISTTPLTTATGGRVRDRRHPTFTNETIQDNLAAYDDTNGGDGGGVYISNGTNTFSGGSISSNTSMTVTTAAEAAAASTSGNGTNTFTGVSITSNQAQDGSEGGGGVYADDGTNHFTTRP